MKHTELPWKFKAGTENDPNAVIESAKAYICQTVAGNDNANAAFIVKACNNHYQLVEALDGLMSSIGGGKKQCGHDFTCVCAWEAADKALTEAK